MAYTFLPPILIVAGLVVALVIVIRRMPQVASLAGEDLAKADASLSDHKENPGKFVRTMRVVGRLIAQAAGVLWSGVKKVARFLFEKVFKRIASSNAISQFVGKLFAKIYRTRTQQVPQAPVATAQPVQPQAAPAQIGTNQALEEEKRDLEEKVELSRLSKEAEKEVLKSNYAKAEELYIEIVKRDAKSVVAYKGLAKVYEQQGNLPDMKASLEQVLALDKHDTEAKKKLEKLEEEEAQPVA